MTFATRTTSEMLFRSSARVALSLLVCANTLTLAQAQEPRLGKVAGTVVDSTSEEPIAGVHVQVEGLGLPRSRFAAVTDANGYYQISRVPAGLRVVRAERFGYSIRTQNVLIDGIVDAEADFLLATRRLIVSTNAVGAIAMSDTVSGRSILFDSAKRVVVFSSNKGKDTLGSIRIRGGGSISTLSDSKPLIVVDGVILGANGEPARLDSGYSAFERFYSMADLDPATIEHIDVIKGTAASSIYGTLAANGVILISTTASAENTSRAAALAALERDKKKLLAGPQLRSSRDSGAVETTSWKEMQVYYATLRNVSGTNAPETFYGESEDSLKYGIATVTIPEYYHPGGEDIRGLCKSLSFLRRCKKGPGDSVTLASLNGLKPSQWLSLLSESVRSGGPKADALVFVHGFNNSFADATKRAAEIAYSINFAGAVLAYDWSSKHSLPGYVVDQERAERSVPAFKEFLLSVADRARSKRIIIIAHSMGTRLVSYAIRDLAKERPDLDLGPIIFAASDVDSAIFVNQLAPSIARKGRPVTLYASSRDRAIKASASDLVHDGARVGSGPPSVVLYDGIDYVDASALETDLFGHGYFIENREVIDDIFLTVKHGSSARDRNLHSVPIGKRSYYRLK